MKFKRITTVNQTYPKLADKISDKTLDPVSYFGIRAEINEVLKICRKRIKNKTDLTKVELLCSDIIGGCNEIESAIHNIARCEGEVGSDD